MLKFLTPLLFVFLVSTSCGAVADANLKPRPSRAEADKGEIYKKGCMVKGGATKSRKCVFGKPGAKTKVVLFGDSHGLQYGPAMIRLAKNRDWKVIALVRADCVVADVNFKKKCNKWRQNSFKRIASEKPDMVVVSSSTGSQYQVKRKGKKLTREASQRYLIKGMAKTLRRVGAKNRKVVLIRDQALAPFRPNDCLVKHAKRPKKCGFKGSRDGSAAFDVKGARRVKSVRVIDPMPLLCPKKWCRAVDRGIVVYRDRYHLTATYAHSIGPWLGKRLPDVGRSQ